ncbi:MAG TPA: hypothetical protein VMZ53_00935 [Kofleriaceae bacterium]|nr:hypothetical protein [Kofleriaceae bacterium]
MVARAAVLTALVLAGCDGVFGLQTIHGDDDDGPREINVGAIEHKHSRETNQFTLPVSTPDGSDMVVLVFAAVGSYCNDSSVPTATLTFNGDTPMPRHVLTGTPCNDALSHSYLWVITDPPTGSHDVAVMLTATAHSLHVGALLLSGVDAMSPVRTVNSATGVGLASSVMVPSEDGDLVVSFIGQGGNIADPGPGNTLRYLDNDSAATTLNNSGASTIAGSSPQVEARWTFSVDDQWQAIAVSLQPAH